MDEKFDSRTIGENPTSQSDEKENRTTSHNTLGMDDRQADPSEHAKKARDPFLLYRNSTQEIRGRDEGVNTNNCYKRSILVRELERYLFCVQKGSS